MLRVPLSLLLGLALQLPNSGCSDEKKPIVPGQSTEKRADSPPVTKRTIAELCVPGKSARVTAITGDDRGRTVLRESEAELGKPAGPPRTESVSVSMPFGAAPESRDELQRPVGRLFVELWPGMGSLGDVTLAKVAGKSFDLANEASDYGDCGVCTYLFVVGPNGTRRFVAETGNVLVHRIKKGAFSATVANARFREVGADDQPLAQSCTFELEDHQFEIPVPEEQHD